MKILVLGGTLFFGVHLVEALLEKGYEVTIALDAIRCGRYIMVSSASVYELCQNIHETAFRPEQKELIWCGRTDFPYDEIKRTAECAVVSGYPEQNAVMVRFPYVIGKDDYTQRLYFYVNHAVKGIPMHVDNPDSQMSFIGSEDAPYNGTDSYSLNTEKAMAAGCSFRELHSWLYGLLDWYVEKAQKDCFL